MQRRVGSSLFVLFLASIGCSQDPASATLGFGDASAGPSDGDATAGDASTGEASDDDDADDASDTSSGSAPMPTDDDGGSSSSGSSDGGNDDAATTISTSADGGGSDETTGTGEPLGTYDYGRCSDGCDPELCITIEGFGGSFCTTPCEGGACPGPTEGDAVGQCLLGPDLMMPPVNCILTCSVADQNCPGDMSCVDAMMGGDAGICLWL